MEDAQDNKQKVTLNIDKDAVFKAVNDAKPSSDVKPFSDPKPAKETISVKDCCNTLDCQETKEEETESKYKQAKGVETQRFDKLRLITVTKAGDLMVRGAKGVRDYLFPISRAVERFWSSSALRNRLNMHNIKGTDTYTEVIDELCAKINEACRVRASLGIEIPKEAMRFYTDLENVKKEAKKIKPILY